MKKLGKVLLAVAVFLALAALAKSCFGSADRQSAATPNPAGLTLQTPALQPPALPSPAAAPTPASGPAAEPLSRDPRELRTERDWNALLAFPAYSEIEACNRLALSRSPQVSCWVGGAGVDTFYAYSVEFRADHVPAGTYCCPGQFGLDYSALTNAGYRVRQDYEGVSLYAGFQRQADGSLNAIFSVWDLYCADAAGNERVVRARQIYPEGQKSFEGEGTGVQCLVPYDWEPGRWYRMELLLGDSVETGNTVAEQWVTDLETQERRLLCAYDLGVPDVRFRGRACLFLENYRTEFSGDVRTMECRELRVTTTDGRVLPLTEGQALSFMDYRGSWRCGAENGVLYCVTSGVENLSGATDGTVGFSLAS